MAVFIYKNRGEKNHQTRWTKNNKNRLLKSSKSDGGKIFHSAKNILKILKFLII